MAPNGLIRLAAAGSQVEVCTLTFVSGGVERRGKMARAAGAAAAGCLLSLAAMALLVSLATSGGEQGKAEEALALNKELEYAAIQAVLRHLDDNHDGSVDLQESEEFVQMELQETNEKSHRFHETDSQITSEDLWQSWQQNEVFYWTNADVVQWLLLYVELPQYKEIFYKLNISGRHLPRLANNTGQILQTLLGVTDSQHKQKLRLRAMDLVLFGPPNGKYSVWKDVVLVLSVSLCVVGVAYALRQRRDTQLRIDNFLKSFREKERELRALQERLEEQKESCEGAAAGRGEERNGYPLDSPPDSSPESEMSLPPLSGASFSSSQSSSFDTGLARAQEEIEMLRREVDELNSQLTSTTISQSLLQSLLQESCRYEREHVERRRREAQDEITRAQRVCDKIKRRRASLFGTFHLANSSALEEAGLQITRAVNNMQKVSESFEEYHRRWRRIEQVCNFSIVSATTSLSFSLASFSLPRDSSTSSLKSLEDLPGGGGDTSMRDSFSRYSEGYGSCDTYSLTSATPDGSPSSSLTMRRRLSGSSSLKHQEMPPSTSTSSLYNHQLSCPLFYSETRGRANTLPSTSSLPRSFTVSSQRAVRQDSYSAAIESDAGSSISGVGLTMSNDRGSRSGRRRLSDTGSEHSVAMVRGRGEGRRNSGKRQTAVLSAVHEEDSRPESGDRTEPVAGVTTHVQVGVTRTGTALIQSTV